MKKLFMFMTVVIFAAFCFSCGNDDIPEPKPNNPQQDTLVPDDPQPDDPQPDDPQPDDPDPDEPDPDEPDPDEPDQGAKLGTFVYEGNEYKIGEVELLNKGKTSIPGKKTEYHKWTIVCFDDAKTLSFEFYFATPINTVDSKPEIPNGGNVVPLEFEIFKKDKNSFGQIQIKYEKFTMNLVLKKDDKNKFSGDLKAKIPYNDFYTGDQIFEINYVWGLIHLG